MIRCKGEAILCLPKERINQSREISPNQTGNSNESQHESGVIFGVVFAEQVVGEKPGLNVA